MLSNFCHCCLRRRLGRLQRQVGAHCTAACRHSRGGDTGACRLSRLYPASTGDDDCLHDSLGSSTSGLRSGPPLGADTATLARVPARQSRAWHPNACVSARGRRYNVLDNLSISLRARSIVGSSPVPIVDSALLIAVLHARIPGWMISDLMGTS